MAASMAFVVDANEFWWRNLLFGIFFGFLWAPINRLMAHWYPGKELGTVTSIWMSSVLATPVIGTPIALYVANHTSWQTAFLLVAALGIPAFILLWIFLADVPEKARGVSAAEVAYIKAGQVPMQKEWVGLREMKALLQPSVLIMSIGAALATVPTWLSSWMNYGLITIYKLDPDVVALATPWFMGIVVVYGFFNGPISIRFFKGRIRWLLFLGPAISAVGFAAAGFIPMHWLLWVFCLSTLGFLCDPMFWGLVNTYWTGLVGPRLTGTANGVSAMLQVAIGWFIVNQSGGWLNSSAEGLSQLSLLWTIGAGIFVVAAIAVLFAREVVVRADGAPELLGAPVESQALGPR